ncbi:MAG: hypothetical protein GY720_17175 [bacterium]|nr:hypothetical protein [bacterium]
MSAWRVVLAALVFVGLGGALVYVAFNTDSDPAVVPTLATAPSSVASNTAPPVTLATPTTSSSSTEAPAIITSTIASAPAVVIALQDALTAWGEFAVTGRMRDLGDHFVSGGPQRRQLRSESEAIRANPPGPPAYVVTTANIFTLSAAPTDVVLRTEIEWARQGEESQFLIWDIQMQLVDGVWQLLTVEEVSEGT